MHLGGGEDRENKIALFYDEHDAVKSSCESPAGWTAFPVCQGRAPWSSWWKKVAGVPPTRPQASWVFTNNGGAAASSGLLSPQTRTLRENQGTPSLCRACAICSARRRRAVISLTRNRQVTPSEDDLFVQHLKHLSLGKQERRVCWASKRRREYGVKRWAFSQEKLPETPHTHSKSGDS